MGMSTTRSAMKAMLAAAACLAAATIVSAAAAPADDIQSYDEGAIVAYLKGVYLESEGDLYSAYQYYLYAYARDQANPRILLRLAKVAAQVGDYDRSREYATKTLTFDEYGMEARLILAEVEYRSGNRERAFQLLGELRRRDDGPRFDILKFYARVAEELKRLDDAIAALEEATKVEPSDPGVWYELGALRVAAGRGDAGIAALEKSVSLNPDHAQAQLALAKALLAAGRRAEAKRAFREALRVDPSERSIIKELTDLYFADGEHAAGADLLEPYHREGSLDTGGEIVYGRFLYNAGRVDSALAVFGALLGKEVDKPPLLRVMAQMESELGRYRTAYGHLTQLIALEPDRFENYTGMLIIAFAPPAPAASDAEKVELTDAERAVLLDAAGKRVGTTSAENNYLLGYILRRAGEYARAEERLLLAEKLDPKNETVLLEVASLYGRMNRFDDALRRVIPLYNKKPDDPTLANFYGYLLAEKGESLELAEKLVRKALDKEPDNGYYLDSLGWIRFKRGFGREALATLRSAAAKADDDPVIWEHIGDVHLSLGERDEARGAYERSIEMDPKNASAGEKLGNLGPK